MRILIQSHSSAPHNFGGAELALIELIDEWRELDQSAEFLVVAPPPVGGLQERLASRGIRVATVEFEPVVGAFATSAALTLEENLRGSSAVASVRGLIREFGAELVVTNTIVAPWAALAAAAEDVPHIWFAHEYGAEEHGLQFRLGKRQTFSDIAGLSGLVVANSVELREYLATWVPSEKLRVVHPLLAPAKLREQSKQVTDLEVPRTGRLRVVCAGRISEAKGQHLLVDAVAKLAAAGVDVEAWFVGIFSGSYETEFRARIAERDVDDRVTLFGDQANPYPFMAAADVGVSLSYNESFGRVPLEFLALGVPVIATRTGASSLIREGRDGFIITPGNLDELLAALQRLAEPALRNSIATAALERADEIHAMYPLSALLPEMQRGGRLERSSLPHAVRALMNDPTALSEHLRKISAAEEQVRSTSTWRVGRFALAPVRACRLLLQRAKHRPE